MWKDIKGFEGLYQVSDEGIVRSLERTRTCRVNGGAVATMTVPSKILKQWKRSKYNLVDLYKYSKRHVRSVHVLVYETFKGVVPKGFVVHHKDENKLNNNLNNLEMLSCTTHNRTHLAGRAPWNKGLKMPAETLKKAWETRRRKQEC